jgi:hypothetical protein
MLKHLKSVLNFSAFRPEEDDPQAPWKSRFAGRNTVLVHVGRSHLSFVVIGKKGEQLAGEGKHGELKALFAELGPAIKNDTADGWCMVSLDSRYVISVENNLSRKKGSEDAVKKDPRSVLHARFERGKRYAVTHNPETNSSILLAMDEENVKKTEAYCKEQGLKPGRICCGTYVLLRHALGATNTKKGSENPVSVLYVACCSGSVCALLQEKDNWMELRSRPDLFEPGGDIAPFIELLRPFQERLGPDRGLVVACDEPVPGLTEKLAELFPGRPINDLTEPGLLARLLYRN